VFSSNSIYGIIDILLMNWGNDPNFTLTYDQNAATIIVNNMDFLIKYVETTGTIRGEDFTNE
jgi:hypothetical protein